MAAPAGLFSDRLYEERRVRGLDATAVQRYFHHPFGVADPRGWELHGIPEQHIPLLIRDGERFIYGGTELQ